METQDSERLSELAAWLEFEEGPIARKTLRLHYRMRMFRRFTEICKNAPAQVVEYGAEF